MLYFVCGNNMPSNRVWLFEFKWAKMVKESFCLSCNQNSPFYSFLLGCQAFGEE